MQSILITLFIILLISCTTYYIDDNKISQSSQQEIGNEGITLDIIDQNKFIDKENSLIYSNITQEDTKKDIKAALLNAGLKKENIENFMNNVDWYNSTIKNTSLTENGFTIINKIRPNYDIISINDFLMQKDPDFIGNNCRITSYSLMKDIIIAKNTQNIDTENLIFDLMALKNSPIQYLTISESKIFKALFGKIHTPLVKDLETHIKSVKGSWKERGVEFLNQNTTASLISVFMHNFLNNESYLIIGHVGVLVPFKDNRFLFIEKLTPDEPYQADIFSSKQELIDYLMKKYDIEYNQPTARPFIFENDALIRGFRYNKENTSNK